KMYVDGANVATKAGTQGPFVNNEPFVIGGRDSSGNVQGLMNGSADEVRVSNVARSAGWIATEYTNQSNPSSFYVVAGSGGGGTGGTVPTTVTSVPAGLSLTVDGSACIAPCTFQWAAGGSHTIGVTASTQAGAAGTQYLYANWSDGG